jgi:N-acetylmuramoyl-L-alanine amidase
MALTIVTREQWGARYPRSSNRVALSSRRWFVCHWPGSGGTITNEAATVRSIEQQHANQGWSARPGYNFLVGQSGTIFEGAGRDVQGVHCPGRNTDGIGVCILQTTTARLSDAAKRSTRALYDDMNRATGRTLGQTWHAAHFATACPGNEVIAWIRAGMIAPGASTPPTEPPAPPARPSEGTLFIRNKGTVYQLIYNGPQSYWRSIPAGPAGRIPAAWIIDDADGAWLGLWRVGAAA